MKRLIFIALCCSFTSICYAENWGIKCTELAIQAGSPEAKAYPPLKTVAAQSGRLYMYDSPSKYCRVKGHAVTKGDVLFLTVNFSFEAWVNVTYNNMEAGWSGWVSRSNINEIIDMMNTDISFRKNAAPNAVATEFRNTSLSAKNGRWSFVVFGDTRDETQDTQTGISPLLGRIAESIAGEKPDLVIHIGDLINGFYTLKSSPLHGDYNQMLENWKIAVKPIYDFDSRSGIPLYVVRGNHEDGELVTDERLKDAYVKSIASFMPQNGPEQEKGLSYSVSYRQATFIGLDEYSIKELGFLRGLVNQPWLDKQLTQHNAPFMFVFGHVPAFKVAEMDKGPFPDLYFFPEHRDAFWKSLKEAGVSMYFCGHVHFYSRVEKDGIQQVLIGDGGANPVDFDPKKVDQSVKLIYPRAAMKAADIKAGYVIFTVDEMARTVYATQKLLNGETGTWETGDTFITRVK